jgi:nitronate monooxygenase
MVTSFTKLAGIRYPIIQAPIGSATTPTLAAAVSNAGALGTLALTWRRVEEVRRVISETSALTRSPFAVNVVLAWPQEQRIARALEAGARLIWTFWGDPTPHVAQVHAAGGYLMHAVGSLDEALAATAAGVDVLVAQGVEAGGHVRGTTPWRILLGAIREKLPDLPVLVAGGIAAAADVAEALATGAAGACLGTRFLCCTEANVAPVYQERILHASSGDTVLTSLFDKGWPNAPHRVLRNSTVRLWEAVGCPGPGERPGEHDHVAIQPDGTPIERYSDVIPTRNLQGDVEALALYAGQSCERIHDVLAARDIVARLVRSLPAGDAA